MDSLAGQQRATAIACDRDQPGFQGTLPIPAIQVASHAGKRLLRGILGILAMAKHSQTESEHQRMIPAHQLGKRTIVALTELFSQQGIGLIHRLASAKESL